MRIKGKDGFTLVELMITMVVFVLAMVAASNIFTSLLSQFKQQSRIAESNIEGILGLELIRSSIDQAGFGLPWNLNSATYTEAVADAKYDPDNAVSAIKNHSANAYNDDSNPPRAIVVGNNVLMNGSDVLVIKAANIATSAASQKWEYIVNNGDLPNFLREWDGSSAEQISRTASQADHVIIINPAAGSNINNQRVLINNGGSNFDVQLNNGSFSFVNVANVYTPFEPRQNSYTAYVVYGVSPGALRMPFNRADFFIKRTPDIPSRCAPGTGVLYKAAVNHADGKLTELPLLDCVLDMQVVVGLDSNASGTVNSWWGSPTDAFGLTALEVRNQVKEIRVYLIVQEGQKDPSYTYVRDPLHPAVDSDMVYVRDPNLPTTNGNVYGTTKNGYTVPDLHYRWKLHTIAITPYNLK